MFEIDSQRVMTHDEKLLIQDAVRANKARENFIVIRDPVTNNILQVKRNLVVQTGREFTLRKLFKLPYSSENETLLHNRYVCLFGIGSGGAPVSDPFNPITPTSADTQLNTAVPFRIANTANPMPSEDANFYTDTKVNGSDTQYMKKTFTKVELITDTVKDDYYVKATLTINEKDARGSRISELGLFSAVVPSDNTYNDIKIFSRITFETEPLSAATGKGLIVEYYVYA